MSDDPIDDADEPTDDHKSADRVGGSIFGDGSGWLSSLLSALESRGSESTSGRRRADRSTLEYDISIRSIADALEDSTDRTAPRESETPDGRHRRKRRRTPSTSAHHLTTRRRDDELLVTADVGGTDPDEVTVGFSDSTLVVAVAGRELDRIEVPWSDRTAQARSRNGVLTVRIEPEDHGADGETDGADAGGIEPGDDDE